MTGRLVIGADELAAPPPAGFVVCALRTPGAADDSLHFPVPARTPGTVEREAGDGARVQTLLCTGIEVRDPAKRRFHARPIAARVQLTDTRLTIACSSPPRGGWLGGPLALVLNLAARVRARGDQMLVGHVRYAWIQGVYAQRKRGPFTPESVRVVITCEGGSVWLDLTLPGDLDAVAVAETLLRRASLAPAARLPREGADGRMVGAARR